MKIMFVMENLNGGGAERVVSGLIDSFNNKGYEVSLLMTDENNNNKYSISSSVTKFSYSHLKGGKSINVIGKIYFMIRSIIKMNPDCVISLGGAKIIFLLTLSNLVCRKPLILSERNDPRNYPREKHLRLARFFAFMLSDGTVFQTTEARDYFCHKIQMKSTVIPNPIRGNLPNVWNGKRNRKIVNFGRMDPQKNLSLLINAFALIADKYSDTELDIFGEGPEYDELQNLINRLNLSSKVHLNQFTTNIHEVVKKYSIYVSSSNFEGISNSMLEAMAMGIPTICTDWPSGGARSVINNGINGILVPIKDVQAMATALDSVLGNEELANNLGENAIKIRDNLSIDRISKMWLDFILKTVEDCSCTS